MAKKTLRDRLITHGVEVAPEHGVHESLVPAVVDRVLGWHATQAERADRRMLKECVEQNLAGVESACDVRVSITSGQPWPANRLDEIEEALTGAGFSHVEVARYLGTTTVSLRGSGTTSEVKEEALEMIQSFLADLEAMTISCMDAELVVPNSRPLYRAV